MLVDWLKLAFLGLVLAEIPARIGIGLLGFLSSRRFSALARFGLGYLLGLVSLGTLYLGLACAGLFHAAVIAPAALGLFAACLLSGERRLAGIEAVKEMGLSWPVLFLLMAGAAILPDYLVPVTDHDSYINHLGLPFQYLLAHRAALENVSFTFHFPLPVDLTYALPLLLGDDRLAKVIVLISFAALCAVFADWCRNRGIQCAPWLGPIVALSSGILLELVAQAKNDVPASALLIAGSLLWLERIRGPGAVLLGFALAAKMVYLPLIALILLLHLPSFAFRLRLLVCILLPILPWFAKNYLAIGPPFFPFLTAAFSSHIWGEENRQAREVISPLGNIQAHIYLKTIVGELGGHFLLLLLAPAAFVLKRRLRGLLLACGLGIMVTLAIIVLPRYWLPEIWLVSLIGATVVGKFPVRVRIWVAVLTAMAGLGHILYLQRPLAVKWPNALMPREAFLARTFTTYEEAIRKLKELKVKRVMTVGERAIYRIPARSVHGGRMGETPLIWRFVKESNSPSRLAIKFRQTGASHMLYNYVSAEWLGIRYGVFPWDGRMALIYRDYCKLYRERIWRTETSDYLNGGMVLYRLRSRPVAPKPAKIWFAPGIEQIYAQALELRVARRYRALLGVAQRAHALFPDVGTTWNELGWAYLLIGENEKAYHYLKEFADEGMVDGMNLLNYAIASLEMGRMDQGEALLREALVRCKGQHGNISANLAKIDVLKRLSGD